MNYRILIVDDEKNMCRSLEILLESETNCKTSSVTSAEAAIKTLDRTDYDLVVTDLTMPGMNGMELLRYIKEHYPQTQVIMMTAYSTVQSAIEAIKIGAYDYLLKPFNDDEFLLSVRKALEISELKNENVVLKELLADKEKKEFVFVADSPAMKELVFKVEKVAPTNSNILITGESGTGKEVIARLVHITGSANKSRFIAINCASIPENLLESELFGYEKGAFSGAVKKKQGKFELAPNGIIFLDEIAEMPLSLQAKLLRVIEEKTFERLGGVDTISFSSRIIAATNKDLQTLVKEGRFREDLFYRLNVFRIDLPPLRERKEDIPGLIKLFLRTKRLSDEAYATLLAYDFPGNIRELSNIIESASIVARGNTIKAEDLPLLKREITVGEGTGLKVEVNNGFAQIENIKEKFEREIISEAIKMYGSLPNDEIAKMLGTTRRILEARMKHYGISK